MFLDPASGKVLREVVRVFPADLGFPPRGRASPDGRLDVTFHRNQVGVVWDMRTGKELGRFRAPFADVPLMSYSADGRVLATASRGGDMVVYRLPQLPAAD
jgi:hypothetical protein